MFFVDFLNMYSNLFFSLDTFVKIITLISFIHNTNYILQEEKVAKEVQWFKDHKSFERTYGWSWFLKLYQELHLSGKLLVHFLDRLVFLQQVVSLRKILLPTFFSKAEFTCLQIYKYFKDDLSVNFHDKVFLHFLLRFGKK